MSEHACRPGCGACCIAPSISTAMPGLPGGKAAGLRCPHLDKRALCALFGQSTRPRCCSGLQPSQEMCGDNPAQALAWLSALEEATSP